MARLVGSIFLFVCIVGHLQASSFFKRDDLTGFPELGLHRKGDDNNVMQADEDRVSNELDNYHCDPLETLGEQLFKSTAIQVILDASQPAPVKTTDELFNVLKAKTGFDPRDHDFRHSMACALYGIKNLNDVAAMTGLPLDIVDMQYSQLMSKFKSELGGVAGISTIINITTQYNTWLVNTGYPDVPLKGNPSYNDIRDLMEMWQAELIRMKIPVTTRVAMLNSDMSPFKFDADFIAMVLTGYTSTEQVLKLLCINDDIYNQVHSLATAGNIKAMNEFFQTLMKIVKELEKMGLFNLKRA